MREITHEEAAQVEGGIVSPQLAWARRFPTWMN